MQYYYNEAQEEDIDKEVIALNDAIAREERWIALLEAEIVLHQQHGARGGGEVEEERRTKQHSETSIPSSSSSPVLGVPDTETADSPSQRNPVQEQQSALDCLFQLKFGGDKVSSSNVTPHVFNNDDYIDSGASEMKRRKDWLTACSTLGSRVRNFCFTSAVNESNNDVPIQSLPFEEQRDPASSKQQQRCTLEGYFLANKSVWARILLTVDVLHSTNHSDAPKPRIADIQCTLISKQDPPDYWSWLQNQVNATVRELETMNHHHKSKKNNSTHYLSCWITHVSDYLEFDACRRTQLSPILPLQHRQKVCGCSVRHPVTATHFPSQSLIYIPIHPLKKRCHAAAVPSSDPPPTSNGIAVVDKGDQRHRNADDNDVRIVGNNEPDKRPKKPGHVLVLLWVWRWRERKSYLRISNENDSLPLLSTPGIRQPNLDQLVAACNNDCWQTIRLLLTHCSGCTLRKVRPLDSPKLSACDLTRPLKDLNAVAAHNDANMISGRTSPPRRADSNSSDDARDTLTPVSKKAQVVCSPFRLSPSGRHRSDYEVKRFKRIHRNEQKLSQLGLLHHQRIESELVDDTVFPPCKTKDDNSSHALPFTLTPRVQLKRTREGILLSNEFSPNYGKRIEVRNDKLWENQRSGSYTPVSSTQSSRPNKYDPQSTIKRYRSNGFSITSDNCIVPKNEPPKDRITSLFRRPRGKPPQGFEWNSTVGVWAPSVGKLGAEKDDIHAR